MLTVITGTPGAGKTLYSIEKLILPFIGKSITKKNDDGTETEYPRKIFTNINGLQVDHELINDSDKGGLKNWHEWAQPGSIIVYDEFQKVMPPRANGSAVPPFIQHLDTHRHMGVDFVLITQNVINVDRHVHGLTGRHVHIRRMGYMPFCIVYEWDHCSRQLLFSKAISQGTWRYDKKIFKLYHSADLHTKTPRRIPVLVWFILMGLIGAPVLAYNVYQSHLAKIPKTATGQKPTSTFTVLPAKVSAPVDPFLTSRVGTSTLSSNQFQRDQLKPAIGCIASSTKCNCFDSSGVPAPKSDDMCEVLSKPGQSTLPQSVQQIELQPGSYEAIAANQRAMDDLEVLRWMHRR